MHASPHVRLLPFQNNNVILQAMRVQSPRVSQNDLRCRLQQRLGAFSVVDTEAGRAASFAVSLDWAVGLAGGLCLSSGGQSSLAAGHADRNSLSLMWYWFMVWLLGLRGCTYFDGLLR
jgi:hypothetical protein